MITGRRTPTTAASRGVLLLALLLALGLAVPPTTAAVDDATLDQAFGQLQSYTFGDVEAPLHTIRQGVRERLGDPVARAALARRLESIVNSDASPDAIGFALRELAFAGDAQTPAAIQRHLQDPRLGVLVVQVLASVGPSGQAVLRSSLDRLDDAALMQAIDGLVVARDEAAVAPLADLALGRMVRARSGSGPVRKDQRFVDAPAARRAALQALSVLGTEEAAAALRAVAAQSAPGPDAVLMAALLRGAERRLAGGDRAAAQALVGDAATRCADDADRLAVAAMGVRAAAPDDVAPLLAMLHDERAEWSLTAVELVRSGRERGFAERVAEAIGSDEPERAALMLAALAERGDRAALPTIERLAVGTDATADPAIRSRQLAAIRAVGRLGDAGSVATLAPLALADATRSPARAALVELSGPGVAEAIVGTLRPGGAADRVLLAGLLADRRDSDHAPVAIDLCRDDAAAVRQAAFAAAGELARLEDLDALATLVLSPREAAERARAAASLAQAATRQTDRDATGAVLARALESAVQLDEADRLDAELALLEILPSVGSAPALHAAQRAAGMPELRPEAVRVLAAWPDASAAPLLRRVLENEVDPTLRPIVFAGYVRTLGLDGAGASDRQAAAFADAMQLAANDDERRAVLRGLAAVASPEALAVADGALSAPSLSEDAAMAVVAVAAALPPEQARTARAAIARAIAAAPTEAVRRAAGAAMDRLEKDLDFVVSWQVAGPFAADGKGGEALMDVAFAPETDPDGSGVFWRELMITDPSRPGVFDLGKAVGGENCCAYLRTRVWSPREQTVRLELGSDDGIKVWLDGTVVHANNAMRGLRVGEDVVPIALAAGWNTLLVKVTQGGGGWEACCRIRDPLGFPADGVVSIADERTMQPLPGAIVLMDGSGLDAWSNGDGDAPGWTLADGVATVVPGAGPLLTRQAFGDCTLFVEFRCPDNPPEVEGQARSNSGVYVQGRYEVQVLDSFGDPPANNLCGGIYGKHAPLVNAARRPGEWQCYRIEFTAPRWSADGKKSANARMSVWHNGVRIHDDVEVDGTTNAGRSEGTNDAPLMLQDHGNPVQYRNVWIVPRTAWEGPGAPGFVSLAPGPELAGWTQRGGKAAYRFEDGAIVGETRPSQPNSFLCTSRDYDDFVLELEFKVDPALNSGIQVRSQSDPSYRGGVVHGYQVEIDPSERAWTAGIYDESRRGWLVPLSDGQPAKAAFRQGEWNQLRIEARGPDIRTWLNGVPAAVLWDSLTPSGFIGLQVHGVGGRTEPIEVRWRDLRIRELSGGVGSRTRTNG